MTPTQDTSQQVDGERERLIAEFHGTNFRAHISICPSPVREYIAQLVGMLVRGSAMERENEALRAANSDFIKLLNVCAERERDSEDFFDAEINSTIAGHTAAMRPGATPKGVSYD